MVGRCNVAIDEHAVQRATPLVYCTARVRSDDGVEETSSRVPNVFFGIAQGIGDNLGVMAFIMTVRLVTCNIPSRERFSLSRALHCYTSSRQQRHITPLLSYWNQHV